MSKLTNQSGSSLIESMISIVILSFGVLGIARLQTGMLVQSMDAQSRVAASALAEDLLSMVRIDTANAPCYTLPAQGACGSQFALSQVNAWAKRASSVIPGVLSYAASMPDATQFSVQVTWASKAFKEARNLQVLTDVRQ